jgi:1-acyl-sn-glycerol-3-phosphate acyltransferase
MFSALKMLFVYVVAGGPTGIVFIPYSLLIGNVRLFYRIVMRIMSAGVRAAGIQVEVTGLEHVPPGVSCIFISNHVSNLDPPVLFPVLPGMSSVLLKKSLMKIPLLGIAMRMGKFVPVERGNQRQSAKASVEAAADALRSGLHILIFAEGTRSRDGRLAAFKRGPFFLAEETGAPVVPMAISGTQTMMRKGSLAIHPGVARIQLLQAIDPAHFASRDALSAAVRRAIADALPPEMKPLG